MMQQTIEQSIHKAMIWCLAWGDQQAPQNPDLIDALRTQPFQFVLEQYNDSLAFFEAFQQIESSFPASDADLKTRLSACPELLTQKIGLVYGGATKIKQYVFESSKLPEVRGASALLDRINLVDLPAFFGADSCEDYRDCHDNKDFCGDVVSWVGQSLTDALIPELIVYSSGGNILAMCPPAYTQELANAIEKRYISETITANACATGENFKLAEFALGLLPDSIEQVQWVDWYQKNYTKPIVEAYYGKICDRSKRLERFQQIKSFNELVRRLASSFNQRRSGFDGDLGFADAHSRPSRAFPPMLETHPYLQRDLNDKRGGLSEVELPGKPIYSDVLFRKRRMGAIAKSKKNKSEKKFDSWFDQKSFTPWEPGEIRSWTNRFTEFLSDNSDLNSQYYGEEGQDPDEAISLKHVGNANKPKGYIAYIYADGNNMGGYIQKIRSAAEYRQFSLDVSRATEEAVYVALAQHLHPHKLEDLDDDGPLKNGDRIHPFEILTIGGDDVLLMVPANKALDIAKTLCQEFESRLLALDHENYYLKPKQPFRHRYKGNSPSECRLSMSAGVLITSDSTPIYYAESLTNQLLKSAKKHGKALKSAYQYQGGTIDFMVLKGVNMISSNVKSFRENGLEKQVGNHILKLYGAPYTLHEIAGLIKTVEALKASKFPRSQLYQIRSLLEQGKKTAMLNYRYFRVRLAKDSQSLLKESFEEKWCRPDNEDNKGNLAPWIQVIQEQSKKKDKGSIYETNWRELVDLYTFIPEATESLSHDPAENQEVTQ